MVQKGTIIFTLLHGRHHGQGTVLRMMPNCPILNLNTPIVQGSSTYEANAISLMGLNLGLWTMLVPGPQGSNQGYVQVSNIDIEQARVVPEFGEQSRLTVLSYDLVDLTSILATSDLEDYQDLIAAFQRMVCGAVANAGGSSPEIAGDGGVTFFGSRADAHDAATSAIETGLQIVEGCRLLSQERARNDLHVRIGIATSKVVVERGNRRSDLAKVTGLAPAMATRLQALAQPDTVLVSQEARDLAGRSHVFRFLGERSLKGFAQTEGVCRRSGTG